MRLQPRSLVPAGPVAAHDPIGPGAWARAGVSTSGAQRVLAVAIVPMVAMTVWLALTSDHLQRPVAGALYWSYLTAAPMIIGLYWWVRRPASSFGPLLAGFGILSWVVSWQSSDWAPAFDVGVLAEAPFFWVTFYLFLAFPMGRLQPAAARWVMAALAIGIVSFFLPWALFSPVIAGGGPLTSCAPSCPENVLQLGTAPTLVEWAGKLETYAALALTLAAVAIYIHRILSASRPQRRALLAVAGTSLLFLPAYFVFNLSAWILHLDPATLDAMAWAIVATRVMLPLGFLIALLQAERFAARALGDLIRRLAMRPTPEQWRDAVAGALDDPALRLGFFDPDEGRFRRSDGEELARPPAGSGRAWVPIERGGRPAAAMVVDETLTEDPELIGAAASATLMAVENGHLEGELRASRVRILEAGQAERRRIERDLHDSAQQRLVALRIHLALAGEQPERADKQYLARLGDEVEEAIDDLRSLTNGVYPRILTDDGIRPALAALARRSPVSVSLDGGWRRRHAEVIETTVYFCCVECVQNVSKHAGRGASASIRLGESADDVSFSVEDDGPGFDPVAVQRGNGLVNLADRVAAVGGTLEIAARSGSGTRVTGRIPSPAGGG